MRDMDFIVMWCVREVMLVQLVCHEDKYKDKMEREKEGDSLGGRRVGEGFVKMTLTLIGRHAPTRRSRFVNWILACIFRSNHHGRNSRPVRHNSHS